jgi:hypothetical protein
MGAEQAVHESPPTEAEKSRKTGPAAQQRQKAVETAVAATVAVKKTTPDMAMEKAAVEAEATAEVRETPDMAVDVAAVEVEGQTG